MKKMIAMLLLTLLSLPVAAEEKKTDAPQDKDGWIPLFNGKNLDGWKVPNFGGEGEVRVLQDGTLEIGMGVMITGVTYTKDFPKTNYEIELQAMRTQGSDFFGSITFPIGDGFATFITGGWGGGVFGISCIDGMDASENDQMQLIVSKDNQWYTFRVRVTDDDLECYVDGKRIIWQPRGDVSFKTRMEVDYSQPLGITAYCSECLIKNVRYRKIEK
ncbi:MAG: DUF1080 domain-containing protein [Planctomycetia bacterium]|nr:DUF1080 domain-containing protein [Planctomycetia bacterium]